uniref:Uncharacterized protein n=1 Tax=Arundo donax TaxID=35708 RepID=A0A0A8ZPT3_ARUDO
MNNFTIKEKGWSSLVWELIN